MQGTGSGDTFGFIPRCLAHIGAHKTAVEKEGWVFSMEVSCLEINNKGLRDLLIDNNNKERKLTFKIKGGRRMVDGKYQYFLEYAHDALFNTQNRSLYLP